jgi:hypothetical protein
MQLLPTETPTGPTFGVPVSATLFWRGTYGKGRSSARLLNLCETADSADASLKIGPRRREERREDMVSNYPHAIASREELTPIADQRQQSEARFGDRMLGRVRQMFCGLHGHDALLHFEQDRMFLKCISCGRESPGWELNETPPTIRSTGGARRQVVMPPQLISERRIA